MSYRVNPPMVYQRDANQDELGSESIVTKAFYCKIEKGRYKRGDHSKVRSSI